MKKRVIAAAIASLVVFGFVLASGVSADNKKPVKRPAKAKANPLVALLPASDAVVAVNGKRFFNEAFAGVLSANQKLLGEILAKIDSLETKTGVDLRKFDSIVAGVNIIKKAGNDFEFDPVVVGRGTVESAAVIESVKRSADIRVREETLNGRTIYVISAEDVLAKLQPDPNDPNVRPKPTEFINDLAVFAVDANTVAIGSIGRIRETVARKSSVSAEISELLIRKAPGILNFAGKVPGGMSSLLPLDNDELGSNIDSIKTIYGSADVVGGQAILSVTGRTLQAKQAADLKGTFEGLRDLGKGILGGSRAADKQLYARLLGSVRISTVANEISLDLAIPKTDLDALLAIVSK